MKKLLLGVITLTFVLNTGCQGKTESSANPVDSTVNDSTSMIVELDYTKEKLVEDASATEKKAATRDSTKIIKEEATKADKVNENSKPSQNAKVIDRLLKDYYLLAKHHDEEIRAGNQYDSFLRDIDKEARKIDKQLRKYKGEMTKEQLAKYKKADKMLSKTPI